MTEAADYLDLMATNQEERGPPLPIDRLIVKR